MELIETAVEYRVRVTGKQEAALRLYGDKNILLPRCWVSLGFLMCEPYSDKVCTVTGNYLPTYTAFACVGGQHFESVGHITVPEWRRLTGADVLASVED